MLGLAKLKRICGKSISRKCTRIRPKSGWCSVNVKENNLLWWAREPVWFAYSCYLVATSFFKDYKYCSFRKPNSQAKWLRSAWWNVRHAELMRQSANMQWLYPVAYVSDTECLFLISSISVSDDAGSTAGSVRHGEWTITPRLTCQRGDGSLCSLVGMACV